MQSIGLLGGIVWNKRSGNLVSGHQRVAIMDSVNRYDHETRKNDYEFRVEVVDLDDKTEKEQNLFMNNRNVQGTYDDDLLRKMLADIDYQNAGFEEFDLQLLGLGDMGDYNPGFDFGDDDPDSSDNSDNPDYLEERRESNNPKDWSKEKVVGEREDLAIHDDMTKDAEENHKIDRSADFYQDSEANQIARHNEVQKIKDRIKKQNDLDKDGGMLSYVIISFATPTEKAVFLSDYGFDPVAKYINGKEFANRLEFGEEDDELDDSEDGDIEE